MCHVVTKLSDDTLETFTYGLHLKNNQEILPENKFFCFSAIFIFLLVPPLAAGPHTGAAGRHGALPPKIKK